MDLQFACFSGNYVVVWKISFLFWEQNKGAWEISYLKKFPFMGEKQTFQCQNVK